ncbi:hypothetical protein FISHEDRAFT_76016 [Fistulina hepatica ATCC 64428]|uniref:F-box domain-containing protein n=1 Tax=Fistulina hepatica ATCC 64428 TaxID=1128425 RepID=A0A0D7A607_9AGAR|nr:hypothetical protein FISHEDRAFT_76016 [Fistulina hepatica ATCC 64428]
MLYEDVVLHHVGQAAALLRSLRENPALGRLLSSLSLSCFVPRASRNMFLQDLDEILQLAPRANCFVIVSPELTSTPSIDMASSLRIPRSITVMNLSVYIDHTALANLLQSTSNQLISLSLSLSLSSSLSSSPGQFPYLCLENLLSLHCLVDCDCEDSETVLSALTNMVQMPRLRSLTLRYPLAQADTIRPFLAKHGRRLNYLQLNLDNQSPLSDTDLEMFCPSLQHLVILLPSAISFSHPNIRWIDAWWYARRIKALYRLVLWEKWAAGVEPLPRTTLPNLLGIRLFDPALYCLYDLPRQFSPQSDAAPFSITFPGIIDIVHKRGRVYRRDLANLDGDEGRCWYNDDDWDYSADEYYYDSSENPGVFADLPNAYEDTLGNSSDGDYTPSERHSSQYESGFDSDFSLYVENGEDEDPGEIDHDMALLIHSALSVRQRRQSTSSFTGDDLSSDMDSSSTPDREDDITKSHN